VLIHLNINFIVIYFINNSILLAVIPRQCAQGSETSRLPRLKLFISCKTETGIAQDSDPCSRTSLSRISQTLGGGFEGGGDEGGGGKGV